MFRVRRSSNAQQHSVISLGQVWVDIMMDVDSIPEPGGFTVAQRPMPTIGGSFRALEAASRMGSPVDHAGVIGAGIWGGAIRKAFLDHGITHTGLNRRNEDSGFRVVLNSGDPKKTFIATYGAEAHGDEDMFNAIDPKAGDVVHISGNTLLDHSASGIGAFLERAGSDPKARDWTLVLNSTNTLQHVSDHVIEDLVLARPIWSCNRQEAQKLAERLGAPIDESHVTIGGGLDDFMRELCEGLGTTLRAPLVVRVGSRGAWVRTPGGETTHVEGFPTEAVHTRSAGACHTGVMCAMLAQGYGLEDAVRIANAAASLAIQRSINGVPVCPSRAEALALAGFTGESDEAADSDTAASTETLDPTDDIASAPTDADDTAADNTSAGDSAANTSADIA